jgi:hypothetical protein
MNALEMIKQRAEAVKAAQNAGAVPGNATSETSAGSDLTKAVAATSTIATGMQTTNNHIKLAPGKIDPLYEEKELDEERAKKALAVFEVFRLRKFNLSIRGWVHPVKGYFYAESYEELEELKHFAKQGLVNQVEIEQK